MSTSIQSLIICLCLVYVYAANKGEPCDSTAQCADTGLTCSGRRCVCLMDLGRRAARAWACNNVQDCLSISGIAKRTLEITDLKITRDPVCTTSSSCPNLPGTVGYCDVLMAAK
ncbi:uncharacterized protein LOC129585928 [Paramacrobiotus metropolitanus]|uniref:uncharacterized protein LOC129585928 n=1 Tax=Paramacrobiotus metropolitanus TaxID=2943436 RepID=UPI0024460B0A|nr:uncharacterized protein LOC129585928 [Paramacrobiotus metropolitanus]